MTAFACDPTQVLIALAWLDEAFEFLIIHHWLFSLDKVLE